MRAPCHRRALNQLLDIAGEIDSAPMRKTVFEDGETAGVGSFCRAVYASLTITGRSFRQSFRGTTTMRIYGPNGTTLGTPANNARRTSSTGFSLPDAAT